MVAIGGGAGLAGGFTPLLGAVFMLEELTADYAIVTIWPALVISVAAAGFSNIGGEPMFGLGVLNIAAPESEQLHGHPDRDCVRIDRWRIQQRPGLADKASCSDGPNSPSQDRAMPWSRPECFWLFWLGHPPPTVRHWCVN